MNSLDYFIFQMLNFDGGAFFDSFFSLFSNKYVWIPLYLLLVGLVWRKWGWRRALIFLAVCVAGVAAADQLCNLFKHTVKFLRPSHTPDLQGMVHTVGGYVGGLYGTVSAHAANSTVVFIVAGAALGNRYYWAPMALWLVFVCWSRIYLGVHFPSQILLGLILGTMIALPAVWLMRRLFGLVKAKATTER